jgi:hypothetical protein
MEGRITLCCIDPINLSSSRCVCVMLVLLMTAGFAGRLSLSRYICIYVYFSPVTGYADLRDRNHTFHTDAFCINVHHSFFLLQIPIPYPHLKISFSPPIVC